MSLLRQGLSLRQDLDRFFDDWFGIEAPKGGNGQSLWAPAVDIHEDDTNLFIDAELPGLKREEIAVAIEDGVLSLKGEHKSEKKEERNNYVCTERHYGNFYRRFNLPRNVKTDAIDAKYEDGVLHLTLPKQPAAKANQIKIK